MLTQYQVYFALGIQQLTERTFSQHKLQICSPLDCATPLFKFLPPCYTTLRLTEAQLTKLTLLINPIRNQQMADPNSPSQNRKIT